MRDRLDSPRQPAFLSRRELLRWGSCMLGATALNTPVLSLVRSATMSSERLWQIRPIALGQTADRMERTAYLLSNGRQRILANPTLDWNAVESALDRTGIVPGTISAIFLSSVLVEDIPFLESVERSAFHHAEIWISAAEQSELAKLRRALRQPEFIHVAQLRTLRADECPVSGLKVVEAAGPTLGHAALAVETKGQTSVICGQLFDRISLQNPHYVRRRMVSPGRTIMSRRLVMDLVASDSSRLLCSQM